MEHYREEEKNCGPPQGRHRPRRNNTEVNMGQTGMTRRNRRGEAGEQHHEATVSQRRDREQLREMAKAIVDTAEIHMLENALLVRNRVCKRYKDPTSGVLRQRIAAKLRRRVEKTNPSEDESVEEVQELLKELTKLKGQSRSGTRRFLERLHHLKWWLFDDTDLQLESFIPPASPEEWSASLRHLVSQDTTEFDALRSSPTQFSPAPDRLLEVLCQLQHHWMRPLLAPAAASFSSSVRRMWIRTLSIILRIIDVCKAGGVDESMSGEEKLRSISFLQSISLRAVEEFVFETPLRDWSAAAVLQLITAEITLEGEVEKRELFEAAKHLKAVHWDTEAYVAFAKTFAVVPIVIYPSQVPKFLCLATRIRDSGMAASVPHKVLSFLLSPFMQAHLRGVHANDSTPLVGGWPWIYQVWTLISKWWRLLSENVRECDMQLEVCFAIAQVFGISSFDHAIQRLDAKKDGLLQRWWQVFLDLGALMLDYRSSSSTFEDVTQKLVDGAHSWKSWFADASQHINNAAYDGNVTHNTLESVVDAVMRDTSFDPHDRRCDVLEALQLLDIASKNSSQLLLLAEDWVNDNHFNLAQNRGVKKWRSEWNNLVGNILSQTQESLSSEMLKNRVQACSYFRRRAIGEWGAEEVRHWSNLVLMMHEHHLSAIPFYSRADLRAEIVAVVIRATSLYNNGESQENGKGGGERRKKQEWQLRPTQVVAVTLYIICPAFRQSKILQIPTGEGKSWIIAVTAACFAFQGRAVDIMSTCEEVAVRDESNFHHFFAMLSLESSCCCTTFPSAVYDAHIVYGDELHFNGDWLRSQFFRQNTRGSRPFDVCLVDEVDNLLFDRKASSVRLASDDPGVLPISVFLAAMWKNLESIFNHIVEDPIGSGTFYLVPAEFTRDTNGNIFTKGNAKPYSECRQLLDVSLRDYLTKRSLDYAKLLITPLTAEEEENKKKFESVKSEVQDLLNKLERYNDDGTSKNDSKGIAAKQQHDIIERAEQKCKEYLGLQGKVRIEPADIPRHQRRFVEKSISIWTDSAVKAILDMNCGKHYEVLGGEVKVVDHSDTGTVHKNMVWSDGLHQFLELKEGVPLTPLSSTKCFLSSTGYFSMYTDREHPEYTNIYGMTGTLGETKTKRFLVELYKVDMLIIPPYRRVCVKPLEAPWSSMNSTASTSQALYTAKELTPVVTSDAQTLFFDVVTRCTRIARTGRAVLLIVPFIKEAHEFRMALLRTDGVDPSTVFCFDAVGKFNHFHLNPGEIVVATNIAGRAADFIPSEAVEENGGLHVCVSFLPESLRVELQNVGRTCRQGRRGTFQFIIPGGSTPSSRTIQGQRSHRDFMEQCLAEQARKSVAGMRLRDHLLQQFCALINELLGDGSSRGLDFLTAVQEARTVWESWLEMEMSASNERYQAAFRIWRSNKILSQVNHLLCEPAGNNNDDDDDDDEILNMAEAFLSDKSITSLRQSSEDTGEEVFRVEYVERLKKTFVQTTRIPSDVLAEAFLPEVRKSKMHVDDNKEEELEALKEEWGHWLALQRFGDNEEHANVAFKEFAKTIRWRVHSKNIITNPHHYVLKGNRLLLKAYNKEDQDYAEAAKNAYDRAINMDPEITYIAHFYKAVAIIAMDGTNPSEAIAELETAVELIKDKEVCRLQELMVVTSGPRKERLVNSIGSQINFLEYLMSFIEYQIDTLTDTKQLEKFVLKDCINVCKYLQSRSASEDVIAASSLFSTDGLQWLYQFEKRKKIPWGLVSGLLCLSAVLIGIGCVGVACGGVWGGLGVGAISAGVADGMDALSRIFTRDGDMDWKRYGIRKVVSIGVGALFHWSSVSAAGSNVLSGSFTSLSWVKEQAFPLVRDIFFNEVKRSLLQIGITEGIRHIADPVGSEVSKLMVGNVSSLTSSFVRDNTDFKNCVRADVKHQTMTFQLSLERIAKGTALATLHTKKGYIERLSKKEGNTMAIIIDEVIDHTLPELNSSLHAGAKTAYEVVAKSSDVSRMGNDFYAQYAKDIRQTGAEATKLLDDKLSSATHDQDENTKTTTASPSSQNDHPGPQDPVRRSVALRDFVPAATALRNESMSLPSSAACFDSEMAALQGVSCTSRKEEDILSSMTQHLNRTIMDGIEASIKGEVLPVIYQRVGSLLTQQLCQDADARIKARVDEYGTRCKLHHVSNQQNSPCMPPSSPEGNRLSPRSRKTAEKWERLNVRQAMEETIKNIRDGGQVGLVALRAMSDEKRVPVKVLNEDGELLHFIGEQYAKEAPAVVLRYSDGHYECEHPLRTISGEQNDCAVKAFLSGLPQEKYNQETCDSMREMCADRIGQGQYVYSAMLYHGAALQKYESNPLLLGGNAFTSFIKKCVKGTIAGGVYVFRAIGDTASWILEKDTEFGNYVESKIGYNWKPTSIMLAVGGLTVLICNFEVGVAVGTIQKSLTRSYAKKIVLIQLPSMAFATVIDYLKTGFVGGIKKYMTQEDQKRVDDVVKVVNNVKRGISLKDTIKDIKKLRSVKHLDFRSTEKKEVYGYNGYTLEGIADNRYNDRPPLEKIAKNHPVARVMAMAKKTFKSASSNYALYTKKPGEKEGKNKKKNS